MWRLGLASPGSGSSLAVSPRGRGPSPRAPRTPPAARGACSGPRWCGCSCGAGPPGRPAAARPTRGPPVALRPGVPLPNRDGHEVRFRTIDHVGEIGIREDAAARSVVRLRAALGLAGLRLAAEQQPVQERLVVYVAALGCPLPGNSGSQALTDGIRDLGRELCRPTHARPRRGKGPVGPCFRGTPASPGDRKTL